MTTREIQSYIQTHKPLAIYLGRLEMEDMEREAREAGYFAPTSPKPDLNRMEYCGVPLYRVNAESHLGFGHNEPDRDGERWCDLLNESRAIERDLASARGLMLEAADSVHASLAETDISDSRREYREGLERRLRSLANANVDLPDTAAQDSASKLKSPAVSG